MQIFLFYGFLLLFPIFSLLYSIVGIGRSPSRWRIYLPFYIYFLFVAAYSYTPPSGSNVDLIRYYKIIENLSGLSLSDTINRLSDSLYTENVLYWLVASSKMPRLLPAITTTTVYGVGAYIVCDSAKKEDYKYIIWILLTQVVTIPFFSVVVNIRNVFAFSLIVLASYWDLYKHRRNILTYLLYIVPVFMHKTGIIIVIVRLMVPVFKRAYIAAIALIFGLSGLITLAYSNRAIIPFGGAFGTILRKLINSAYVYLLGESQYAERVRNSLGATISRYMSFAFLILLVYLYIRKFWLKRNVLDIDVMGYLLCILSLSCNVIDTPAYWRFAAASSLLITPIMYSFFKGELTSRTKRRWIEYGLSLYLILRFLFTTYRASIDWKETISTFAFTNCYTLVVTLLKSMFIA